MIVRAVTTLPQAYTLEQREDGSFDLWMCHQIDTYTTKDGIQEHDIEVRVVQGITPAPELENDIRQHYEAWWASASTAQD